jgi:N utilization substance protein B
MANRHLARSIALQALFEWDFNGQSGEKVSEILKRDMEEFAPGIDDDGFTDKLISGVMEHRKELDEIISRAAPEWPLDQIAIIDRNVLRIGLFELLFGDRGEVPPKVAINESIELAKSFGGDSSGKFVNGVLGTVYREIGEPGKDDNNRTKKSFDKEKLPQERLAGAVVFRRADQELLFALVHDVFGYWTLSKGHIEKSEDAEGGATREVREELGISDLAILAELGSNDYIASDPEKGPICKNVVYFLAETKNEELKLESSGGLDDARWFKYDDLAGLKIYDDIRGFIERGNALLTEIKQEL